MRSITLIFILMTGITGFAQDDIKAKIDKGLKFESADKKFKYQIGGRIHWDNAYYIEDDSVEAIYGNLGNGTQFRRARLYVSGLMYGNIEFKLQMDFAGNSPVFKDVYVEIEKVPLVGNIRMGHFKEPLRLNALTSSKYITFTERSFAEGFAKDRATGVMLHQQHMEKRMGWQAGAFRNSDLGGNALNANNSYSFTGRITGLPLYNKDNSQLLHLGLAYSYRVTENQTITINGEESSMGPDFVSTGLLSNIDKTTMMGAEFAVVIGPLSLQSEYLQAMLTSTTDTLGKVRLATAYGQISYFLTGESRKYKSSFGGFGRSTPKKNFGDGGAGAWEIAIRYSGTDLNDKHVSGGAQENVTLAVNWYLNPLTRFTAEYILTELDNIGNVSIIQSRLYIAF